MSFDETKKVFVQSFGVKNFLIFFSHKIYQYKNKEIIVDTSTILEWFAVAFGTLGTIMWAAKSRFSKYCGIVWLIGSILWVFFALINKHYGLVVNNLLYIALYACGIYQWVFKKENLYDKNLKEQNCEITPLTKEVAPEITQHVKILENNHLLK